MKEFIIMGMKIRGDRVSLRPITKSDARLLLNWRNSRHVAINSLSRHKITYAEHIKWFSKLLKDKASIGYIITINSDNKPIGRVGLRNIDLTHKMAELEKMIGEKEFQGLGFATEASKLLLTYAFAKLGLRRIYAKILPYNLANIKVNKKLGFRIEGILRKHAFIKNKHFDIVLMGLLKEDFVKRLRSLCANGKRI